MSFNKDKKPLNPRILLLPAFLMGSLILSGCQTSLPLIKSDRSSPSISESVEQRQDQQRAEHAQHYLARTEQLNLEELAFDQLIKQQSQAMPFELEPDTPYENLWDELASNFQLMESHQDLFQEYIAFYLNNPRHLERISVRASPYLYFIYDAINERGMPYELAMLPIIESAFYPYARSNMSAVGLWQFIPSTGRMFELHQNWWFDGRQDIYLSTHAALDYLETLYDRNNQDWFLALASYNAGYGRILQATARLKRANPNAEINYWSIRPYLPAETRHYVPQLLAVSYLIKNREKYNLTIEPIQNEPYLALVELDRQIDLNQAAKMAGVSNELLKHLNPGYLKTVTPPEGPHHLFLPINNLAKFNQNLANNSRLFDIKWARHEIRQGDTLGAIALRYGTSIDEIRRLNNIHGNTIRAGRTLLIPIPANETPRTLLAQNTASTSTPSRSASNPNAHRHQVARGESLSVIAQQYGVSINDIIKWNNLNPRQPLQIAQTLEIRQGKIGHKIEHQVREGESLWVIARRYNVTVNELLNWNRLSNASLIRPGTKLDIWQAGPNNIYTVRRGDTIWDIARNYNITSNDLMRYNNMNQNQFLRPGQVLRIPGRS
ncbi:LysM peptidoglycan-binding domain-containing protein [Thiomicrospira sp. R3]|uniref:LysM peptidoglycan-binding domain-containing protein n=1 Tax=Thiomicrospira sp. R3 TaxID=3035472 RepID=UPI00259BE8F9|nr:LysM peptidoglycan-binding domain-containing protein [Thiomicrospira sp. R3]WFE68421.1 LysM peptidoglycan-binding domain-containing protein [Thiomicrospira sp. R3]